MRTPVVANDIQVAHSELERRVPERAASLEQRYSELRSDVEKRVKLEVDLMKANPNAKF